MDLCIASEPVKFDCSDDGGIVSEMESEDEYIEDEKESLIEEESDNEIYLPDYYFADLFIWKMYPRIIFIKSI